MLYSKHVKIFLALTFCAFFAASCKLPRYKITAEPNTIATFEQLHPINFGTKIYSAAIDGKYGIKKYRLSGLLILKQLEDSTTRAVFQSEAGLTLFDFEWDTNQHFKVVSIVAKMNKQPLILALKKDFEILMKINLQHENSFKTKEGDYISYIYPLERGFVDYRLLENQILDIKVFDNNKTFISFLPEAPYLFTQLPNNIRLVHHKAKFTITLKALENHAPTE